MNDTKRPNLIAVAGQQRGGTTVFRALLGTSPDAADMGEIFSGAVTQRGSFWKFLAQRSALNSQIACPHYWYQAWEEYVIAMKVIFHRETLIFDMKADHVPYIYHHDAFSYPHRSQFFFSWNNLKVIHLERKNVIAQLVSKKVAEARNNFGEYDMTVNPVAIWNNVRRQHADDSEAPEIESIRTWRADADDVSTLTLDIEGFHQNLLGLTESNKFLTDAISCFQPLHLVYEDLFDVDGNFSTETLKKIGVFLAVEPSAFDPKPLMKKQSQSDFLAPISNRDELIEKYSNTEFSWMLS